MSFLDPYFYTSVPCILLSIQIILLGSFVIRFYRNAEPTFVPMMYILISSSDILSAVGFIHQSIVTSLYASDLINARALRWNFAIFYALTSLSYRSSVFYNVVLAVCRTINIVSPFYVINKKAVITACTVYPAIWAVVITCDVYELFKYQPGLILKYQLEIPLVGVYLCSAALPNEGLVKLIIFSSLFFPFLVPVVIVFVACIIQVVCLYKTRHEAGSSDNHVTVTIFMISTLFVICNSVLTIFSFTLIFLFEPEITMYVFADKMAWFGVVLTTIFPLMNGAFNPVIIVCRSSGLRREFVSLVSKARERWNTHRNQNTVAGQ